MSFCMGSMPSNLYPKKQFILPNIMSEDEVAKLFNTDLTLKEYCVIGLLYGCGMRIREVCSLRLKDIESSEKRIKVYQGKGAKDRYTLLPNKLLENLRTWHSFYIAYEWTNPHISSTHTLYCERRRC
jgi:integrase/recombinase XerD